MLVQIKMQDQNKIALKRTVLQIKIMISLFNRDSEIFVVTSDNCAKKLLKNCTNTHISPT